MPNELDQFLKDTEQVETNPFAHLEEAPATTEPPKEEDKEEDGIKPKNRRERRILEKLEAERQSSIELARKVEALSQARNTLDTEDDYLSSIEQIYGTDSPEAKMATDLLKKAFTGATKEAEERAYNRIKSEREQEQNAIKQAENELDTILDEIEDTYDVDLTEAQEKAYFALLQKMSRKNKDGEVESLADPHAVWEVFQEKMSKRPVDNRAKELSARSMTQSGATKDSTLEADAGYRALREMGVL
jgi:hypothetical protein